MNTPENNLDYLAAKHAKGLVENHAAPKELENSLTKALGVLQEDGLYACALYLRAKENGNGERILKALRALWTEQALGLTATAADPLEYALELTGGPLEQLLLARLAAERMLTYARYSAKARD